jgi:alkylation response protein AidB-like acyl-CoA dehydrogenase
LGREICGGNGLLHENYAMRALTDMEAVYTYEGTYEINALVAGRQLTGLSAFTK